ncbi:MAG TPA: hypothetical protein VK779_02560 [Rhizomicrobium sp.]|jgi:hypothetical protein|nr:hypothetical protein [Rhizomicrobium sp.]
MNAGNSIEPKVFIFGDSHSTALAKGKEKACTEDSACAFCDWKVVYVDNGNVVDHLGIELKDGQALLNPILDRLLAENLKIIDRYSRRNMLAGQAHELVLLFGYVEMHRMCFNPRWAKRAILGVETEPSGAALPPEMIYELLRHRLKSYGRGVSLLKDLGFKVSLLAGPPPVPDVEFIRDKLPKFKAIMKTRSRLAFFEALNKAMDSIARDTGVPLRNYMDTTTDADGYLLQEYWGDGIHGNAAYGKKILECLYADLNRT